MHNLKTRRRYNLYPMTSQNGQREMLPRLIYGFYIFIIRLNVSIVVRGTSIVAPYGLSDRGRRLFKWPTLNFTYIPEKVQICNVIIILYPTRYIMEKLSLYLHP